jgi:hypothetical protein
MSRITVTTLVFALGPLIATASCSSPTSKQSAERGSASTPTPVSAQPTHFQRLGYSFAEPPGWQAVEGSLDWQVTGGGPPRVGLPAFDDFLSPGSDPRILIGKQPVPDSASLDQWIAHMRASGAITYPPEDCNPAEDHTATNLGGEPAQMVAFHCPTDGPKAAIAQVLVRHADTGWVINCFSGSGVSGDLPGLEKQCGRWISSFRFAP